MSQIKLIDNPINDELRIEAPAILNGSQLDYVLIDVTGKEVFQGKLTVESRQNTLANISELSPNVYFLKLRSNSSGAEYIQKIIKQ